MRRFMNKRSALMALLVVALLGAALALGGRGRKPSSSVPDPSSAPRPPASAPAEAVAADGAATSRVGFIDLETVYNTCKQTKAFDLEVEKFRQEASQKLEPLQKELDQLKELGKNLDPNSADGTALGDKFRAKRKEYEKAAEPEWRDLNGRSLKTRKKIYTLIRTAVAKVAKARGIDLVLADIEEPEIVQRGDSADALDAALREYSMKMQRKAVLYGAREVDLTSAVLEAVNSEP